MAPINPSSQRCKKSMQRFTFATPIAPCPLLPCAARANIHRGSAPHSFRSVSDFSLFASFSPPALFSGSARKLWLLLLPCEVRSSPHSFPFFLGVVLHLVPTVCLVEKVGCGGDGPQGTKSPRLLKNPKWRPVNPLATQSRGHITRASGDPFVVRRRIAGHRAGPSSFFLVLQPFLVHSTSADLAVHGEV